MECSDPRVARRRERWMLDVAGVAHLGRLEQEQLALRVGHGAMLHAAGHDHHFAGVQGEGPSRKSILSSPRTT